MREFTIQVKFSADGKWMQHDNTTFTSIADAKSKLKNLQSEHAINKMYLPDGYKNEYTEFRIVARQVDEWKPIF